MMVTKSAPETGVVSSAGSSMLLTRRLSIQSKSSISSPRAVTVSSISSRHAVIVTGRGDEIDDLLWILKRLVKSMDDPAEETTPVSGALLVTIIKTLERV